MRALLLLISYILILDWTYVNVIHYLFEYQHFTLSFNFSWYMLMKIIQCVFAFLFWDYLNKKPYSFGYGIMAVLMLISFVPTMSYISLNSDVHRLFVFVYLALWLGLLICLILFTTRLRQITLSNFNLDHVIWMSFILLSTVVIYVSGTYTSFRMHFGLFDVYELRTEARAYNVPLIIGYLLTFSDNLLPILLLFFLFKRRFITSAVIVCVILLNFGITGTKQVLLLPFLAMLFYFFNGLIQKLGHKTFLIGLIFVLSLGFLEFNLFGSYFISTLSSYRVLFIPAKLNEVTFEFIQEYGVDYFRQSWLKLFLDSRYSENIGFLIGDYYINDITARANNGLFSEAYINLGYFSILLYPVYFVFTLMYLSKSLTKLGSQIQPYLVAVYSFVFLGLPVSTALFSAGLVFLLFISAIVKSQLYENWSGN